MKKTLITSTAFLLAGAMLLGGCSERGNGYAPGAEKDPSSVSSESSVSEVLSESRSVNSSSGVESSSKQSSDVSAAPVPVEFTDEDRELQEILRNMDEIWGAVYAWVVQAKPEDETAKRYLFLFPELKAPGVTYGMVSDDFYEIPNGYSEKGVAIPQTYNDFKNVMLSFLSEQYVEAKAPVAKGSMTEITRESFTELDEQTSGELSSALENHDGAYFVTLEKQHDTRKLLEIDGKMYRSSGEGGKGIDGVWAVHANTAKVVSKTDDTIEFSYITDSWINIDENGNLALADDILNDAELYKKNAIVGVLKYERGGWKRDWDKADKERWDEWQEEQLREQNSTAEQGSGELS